METAADSTIQCVNAYGVLILDDQPRFESDLQQRLEKAKGESRKHLNRIKEAFCTATISIMSVHSV